MRSALAVAALFAACATVAPPVRAPPQAGCLLRPPPNLPAVVVAPGGEHPLCDGAWVACIDAVNAHRLVARIESIEAYAAEAWALCGSEPDPGGGDGFDDADAAFTGEPPPMPDAVACYAACRAGSRACDETCSWSESEVEWVGCRLMCARHHYACAVACEPRRKR